MSRPRINRPALTSGLLLAGFVLAVGLRVAVGTPAVARSAPAGLAFAACLVALGLASRVAPKTRSTRRSLAIGLLGGLALCLPAIIALIIQGPTNAAPAGYLPWALVVTVVAVGEEYYLRGALFDAVGAWLGPSVAVVISAATFAGLHVPLYGWHVLALDFAVGLWLGALRLAARTWTSPAIAHTLADLLAWWLR